MRRRPEYWRPPGPLPAGPGKDPTLVPSPEESLDCLAGHWKIFQLRRGHRYSTDDLLTAWYAARGMSTQAEDVKHLDLGCGTGSVGMMLLWRFPGLCSVGVEAQARSAVLARRSARYNGVGDRFRIYHGDFRRWPCSAHSWDFDWITCSPPYLTHEEGRRSAHPQRGACRFEDRGGISDYLRVAAACGRPGAGVTWVHATRNAEQNLEAAARHGLGEVRRKPVLFKAGKESLISLFEGRVEASWRVTHEPPLLVRTDDGGWSDDYRAVRSGMGFPV